MTNKTKNLLSKKFSRLGELLEHVAKVQSDIEDLVFAEEEAEIAKAKPPLVVNKNVRKPK